MYGVESNPVFLFRACVRTRYPDTLIFRAIVFCEMLKSLDVPRQNLLCSLHGERGVPDGTRPEASSERVPR